MRYVKLVEFGMVVGVVMSAAPVSAAHYPITREQVASAVSRLGMQVAPGQVTLLADVVATTGEPRLTVRSIEPWGNGKMAARLECESSDQCLPFFASLNMSRESAVEAAASVAPSNAPAVGSQAYVAKHLVVRSGTPALLLLDGDKVHIRLSVICLESGALGQTIRVTDHDRKVVFRAQVVDGGLLKGRL